jgi:hypothetical protein
MTAPRRTRGRPTRSRRFRASCCRVRVVYVVPLRHESATLSCKDVARLAQDKKPKKKKKKGMSKHLMVMWGLGLAVLVGGLSYVFWKLRSSSGKGASKREEKRSQEKAAKKQKAQAEREKLKDKKDEPPPPQDPSEARRVRRAALEERAKTAADSAFIYGMFDGEAVDYREDNKAERESRAAIFERKLQELGATLRKELGARPNAQRHWWGADLAIESESSFTIAVPLRMAGNRSKSLLSQSS